MPTYLYRCKSCSYEFEEIQKFSDEPLKVCPSCKKDTLVRVIGGAGLVFKGSGFYQTDYKKSGGGSGSGEGEGKKPSTEKKESKPETKPDATPSKETTSSESGSSKPESDSPKD